MGRRSTRRAGDAPAPSLKPRPGEPITRGFLGRDLSCVRGDTTRIRVQKGKRKWWVEFLTNLDPDRFPYESLRDLYLRRWEVEFAFRELKVDLMKKRMVRSKTPTRVLQEVYGLLIAYNSIRYRMAQAAKLVRVAPRELSFAQATTLMQFASLNGVPSRVANKILSTRRIHKRPPRSYPRSVKKPASKFQASRARAAPADSEPKLCAAAP